jgi:hypothetical protein
MKRDQRANHTPGPYAVFQRNDAEGFAILANRDGRTVVLAEHWPVTYVNLGRHIELTATAHLLKAAPDLLESAEALYLHLDRNPDQPARLIPAELVEAVRMAISNAKEIPKQ